MRTMYTFSIGRNAAAAPTQGEKDREKERGKEKKGRKTEEESRRKGEEKERIWKKVNKEKRKRSEKNFEILNYWTHASEVKKTETNKK